MGNQEGEDRSWMKIWSGNEHMAPIYTNRDSKRPTWVLDALGV